MNESIGTSKVSVYEVTKDLVLKVKVTNFKSWHLRFSVAQWLLLLVARIMPVKVDIIMK